jgi:hypothetical protein
MLFEHLDSAIPEGLTTPEFTLRPLLPTDVELDYAAVMESKVELRPWEQTGWPADDFMVSDDLIDLVDLDERHREKRSFTYTVLTPDESECLGCVYLMPPDAKSYTRSQITPIGESSGTWNDVGAALNFWVRTSRLAGGLDARLLDALRDWLARDWPFERVVVVTNEQCEQQVELIEAAGLQRRFALHREDQSGAYLAFE